MKEQDYIEKVLTTESPYTEELVERIKRYVRPIHAYTGLGTEVGEVQDQFKKAIFYGKPIDLVNLHEELGDITWYLAIMIDWLNEELQDQNVNFGSVFQTNIKKLMARYGGDFSNYRAVERDLKMEREILSQGLSIEVVDDGNKADDMSYITALEKRVRELESENDELREYKSMYEGLCK